MPSPAPVPKVIGFFFLCDLTLAFLYLIDRGLGRPVRMWTNFIDLDRESNLPTWYSSMQLFLVAVLLAIFASRRFSRREVASWFLPALPLIFALLSLDEIAQLHEKLGSRSDRLFLPAGRQASPFPRTGVWMFLIGVPFFLAMLAVFSYLRRYVGGHRRIIRKFLIALCVFVGSAVGLETLGNFLPEAARVLQVCCEELGEMVGATTFLWATCDLLRREGLSLEA